MNTPTTHNEASADWEFRWFACYFSQPWLSLCSARLQSGREDLKLCNRPVRNRRTLTNPQLLVKNQVPECKSRASRRLSSGAREPATRGLINGNPRALPELGANRQEIEKMFAESGAFTFERRTYEIATGWAFSHALVSTRAKISIMPSPCSAMRRVKLRTCSQMLQVTLALTRQVKREICHSPICCTSTRIQGAENAWPL